MNAELKPVLLVQRDFWGREIASQRLSDEKEAIRLMVARNRQLSPFTPDAQKWAIETVLKIEHV